MHAARPTSLHCGRKTQIFMSLLIQYQYHNKKRKTQKPHGGVVDALFFAFSCLRKLANQHAVSLLNIVEIALFHPGGQPRARKCKPRLFVLRVVRMVLPVDASGCARAGS
jgi:hypothetical protein